MYIAYVHLLKDRLDGFILHISCLGGKLPEAWITDYLSWALSSEA